MDKVNFFFLFLFGLKIYLNLRRQDSVLFKLKENLIKLSRENKAIFINIYTQENVRYRGLIWVRGIIGYFTYTMGDIFP